MGREKGSALDDDVDQARGVLSLVHGCGCADFEIGRDNQ